MQADHIDSKAVLWASVLALMVKNYGRENLNRLAREAKIGPGTRHGAAPWPGTPQPGGTPAPPPPATQKTRRKKAP